MSIDSAPNVAGIHPVEYKCLVFPNVVEEVTEGGIVLPGNTVDNEQTAETKGTLVAVGGLAFSDWEGAKPQAGMQVMIAKYAGVLCKGKDGKEYRLVNDKDILAILE